MTTDIEEKIIFAATQIIDNIEVNKYHSVSAAAISADGQIFTGVNVFHYTGGPCAEMTVLGNAAAAGVKQLTHIVAMGNKERGILNPCGKCRQVLFDYHPKIKVVVVGPDGQKTESVQNLLPYLYQGGDGARSLR